MSWASVAKKEYLENVRNAWVITVSAIFLILTLTTSWIVGQLMGDGDGFAEIVRTLSALDTVGGFLLPILALVLGFGAIAGERESGSLALLAAQRLSRADIVLGKWLGLWGVLGTAIVAGFGLGGLIVLGTTKAGAIGFLALVVFVLETLAWGAAWISITVLLSSFFKRRGTAVGGAVTVWFVFSVVWGLLMALVLFALVGPRAFSGQGSIPGWLNYLGVLNPNDVYEGLLASTLPGYADFTAGFGMQSTGAEPYVFTLAMVAWIGLPYWAAYALFHRRDV